MTAVDSYSYLGSFNAGANARVIIVKINPTDVTSIPTDYNNTKGRCCRFEVIGEVEDETRAKALNAQKVVKNFGTYDSDQGEKVVVKKSPTKAATKSKVKKAETSGEFGIWTKTQVRTALKQSDTKTAAAQKLGVSRSTLRRWETKL